jgi:ATP-dependent RNA helicase DeaD
LAVPELAVFRALVETYEREHNVPAIEIAAALARVAHGEAPFFLDAQDYKRTEMPPERPSRDGTPSTRRHERPEDPPFDTFRLEVGATHGVTASNIVGAIANELRVRSEFIGKIRINEDHSLIDLPEGMPEQVFAKLQKIRIGGRALQASVLGDQGQSKPKPQPSAARHKKKVKK